MRSLARNLIRDESITTTLSKAKALRPYVEKLVTTRAHRYGRFATPDLIQNRRRRRSKKTGRHPGAEIQGPLWRLYPHRQIACAQA